MIDSLGKRKLRPPEETVLAALAAEAPPEAADAAAVAVADEGAADKSRERASGYLL